MTSPFEGTTFVLMWIGFLLLMSSGIVIFFLWAVRAGQFSEQERSRALPLKSGIPSADADGELLRDTHPRTKADPAAEAGRRQP